MTDRDVGSGKVKGGQDRQLGNASQPAEAYDRPFSLGENARAMAVAGCPPHRWEKETRMGRWGCYWAWVCLRCGAGSLEPEGPHDRTECQG